MAHLPKGIRENNPFDISLPTRRGFEGGRIVGAPGQVGFGHFPTMALGYAAGERRLKDYINFGHHNIPGNTIRSLGSFYAADPNWPHTVAKFSRISPTALLHSDNPTQLAALEYGILMAEIGGVVGAKYVKGLVDRYGPALRGGKPAPSKPSSTGVPVATGATAGGAVLSWYHGQPGWLTATLAAMSAGLAGHVIGSHWKAAPAPDKPDLLNLIDQFEQLRLQIQAEVSRMVDLLKKAGVSVPFDPFLSALNQVMQKDPDVMPSEAPLPITKTQVVTAAQFLSRVPWDKMATAIATGNIGKDLEQGIPAVEAVMKLVGVFLPPAAAAEKELEALVPFIEMVAKAMDQGLGPLLASGHVKPDGKGGFVSAIDELQTVKETKE